METTMVPFHDDMIEAVYAGGILVVLKRICENLGIAWPSQLQSLRDSDLFAEEIRYVVIDTPGGQQEMICLPLDSLPLWLASIQSKRVRPKIRPKLVRYQKECRDVLARYFLGDGVNINPEPPVHSTMDIIKQMHQEQGLIIQQVDRHEHLTLPMAQARGFQTVPRSTSRGPVQARSDPGIAATLAAPHLALPTVGQFAVLRRGTRCPLVLTQDDHLHIHTRAACTAIAPGTIWRGNASTPADTTGVAAD